MPAPIPFSQTADDLLREMVTAYVGWDEISLRMLRPISSCMDRARTIGARRPLRVTLVVEDDVSDQRLPLPPGHPTTWGLLTRGTVLEGSVYG